MRNEGFRCGLLGRDRDLGRALPKSVGDDACIVPETLCCRKPQAAGENARPTLRPGTGYDAETAAPARPLGGPMQSSVPVQGRLAVSGFAARVPLYCRAGVHARRRELRRGNAAVLCKRRTAEPCNAARPGRFAVIRKDIGAARRRTPPSSLTRCHLPLQGRLLGGQLFDSFPCKGLRSRAPPAAEKARQLCQPHRRDRVERFDGIHGMHLDFYIIRN